MRTTDELERLTAAEPELLGQTESFVDASEEELILERIVAAGRPRAPHRGRMTRRRRTALVVVGVALAAAIVAVASIGHGSRPASVSQGPHRFRLSGATIQLAGYRFRTPAGFKAAGGACNGFINGFGTQPSGNNPFSDAGSADGGCVEAAFLVGPDASPPAGADPIAVGSYNGFLLSEGSQKSVLYVELPNAGGPGNRAYLELFARGLTPDQLVAVAQSGLPG